MNLEEAIERAASSLPVGWSIHISVENGSGWVQTERPDGSRVDMHSDDADFREQVLAGIRLAYDEMAADELSKLHQGDSNT